MFFTVFFEPIIGFGVNSCFNFNRLRLIYFGASGARSQCITYFLCHNNIICATKSQEVFEKIPVQVFSRLRSLLSSLSSPNGCQLPVIAFGVTSL